MLQKHIRNFTDRIDRNTQFKLHGNDQSESGQLIGSKAINKLF
jgi:hypothetical protein